MTLAQFSKPELIKKKQLLGIVPGNVWRVPGSNAKKILGTKKLLVWSQNADRSSGKFLGIKLIDVA